MADSTQASQTQIDFTTAAPLFDQGLFEAITIDGDAFSAYRPYQLVIVEARPDGDNVRYAVTPWKFTLPISPQSLDIDMPVPTEVRPALTGITEQHAPAVFRTIQLSGTTGIVPTTMLPGLPDKNTAPTAGGGANNSVILAGAVTAATTLANTASKLSLQQPNVNKLTLSKVTTDNNAIYERSTGYYQFHLLRQFLEAYVALKSNPVAPVKNLDKDKLAQPYSKIDPRNVRLAFCVWKDSSVYLCSLQNFRMSRSAANPMEYQYSLSLKAWKRTQLDQGFKSDLKSAGRLSSRTSSVVGNAIRTVTNAIATVNAAVAVIQAVVQEATVLTTLVTGTLQSVRATLKNIAGTVITCRDLPVTLQAECLNPIAAQWNSLKFQWPSLSSIGGQKIDRIMTSAQALSKSSPGSTPNVAATGDLNAPDTQAALQDMFDSFTPNQLQLPPPLAAAIRKEKQRIQNLTAADFSAMQDGLTTFINDYTELIGLGDPTYARLYGRPIRNQVKVADSTDFQMLYSLQDVATVLDGLASDAALGGVNSSLPNSIDYISGLAQQSGIAFTKPVSKFAIPFPYGATLESLAQQYLGDWNRWFEIAALNGLQSPYVDEEGLSQSLLTNADAASVVVADSSQLFLGQTVYLAANGTPRVTRHILGIDVVAPGYVIVTLDGLQNITAFTTAAQAQLQYWTPNTTNSQKALYIPSDQVGESILDSRSIPGVDQLDPLINIAGLGMAIDTKNDLIFSPSGRTQIAFGLQNLIQKIRVYLATPLGSILPYPALGFRLQVGSNLSDVNATEILSQARKLFSSDASFSGIRSGVVSLSGPTLTLTLDVGIAGISTFLPVSVTLQQ